MLPVCLRCEYKIDPLGIDVDRPRLTWQLEAEGRGRLQTAYQIQVASSPQLLEQDQADRWDSGHVQSAQMLHIPYGGQPLASREWCWWRVRVWDEAGAGSNWSQPAHWSMGLLAQPDWQAKWISDPKVALAPLDCEGCRWIWIPGEDPRDHVPAGWHAFRKTFRVEAPEAIDRVRVLTYVDNHSKLYFNGRKVAQSNWLAGHQQWPQYVDLTGLLRTGDNVVAVAAESVPDRPSAVLGRLQIEQAGREPVRIGLDGACKCWTELVPGWNAPEFDDSAWPNAVESVVYGEEPWGKRDPEGQVRIPPVWLRREFTVKGPVARAVLHATAHGVFECSLNGRKVGRDLFTPGWSDYPTRLYTFTYDVTEQLAAGPNALGAIVAPGWYAGNLAWELCQYYGSRLELLAQLEIEYADGTRQTVATGEDWQASLGPTLQADMLMGEIHDARREQAGWDQPGFGGAGWRAVQAAPVTESDHLENYPGLPVRAIQEVEAKVLTEPRPGEFVFDMGQNLVGHVRLRADVPAGTQLYLRHGEVLNSDGTLHTTNLRRAHASDLYVARGEGEVVWEPRFTFHGFRYVELTGLPQGQKPTLESVTAIVTHTDLPMETEFECSHPMINQLWSNIRWGMRSNYLEVPTDCPQRDERLGWTGDAQVFIGTAAALADVGAFFTKWLIDLNDAQRADGAYPDVAPFVNAVRDFGNAAWADAGIICPYVFWQATGDTAPIERHWTAMNAFMDFMASEGNRHNQSGEGYGDWLSINAETPKKLIGEAYYAYDARLMSEMARAIGREDEAAKFAALFEQLLARFVSEWVEKDGKLKGETQTAYVLALFMDLLPEAMRPLAAGHLVHDIAQRGDHLSVGFVGISYLCPVLSRIGRDDLAYKLLLNDTFPSWGFEIKNGATTIWERWNSWTPEEGFGARTMNSFNHYAFGSIGQWLVETMCGVKAAEPGYGAVAIRPRPGGGLTHARMSQATVRGPVLSEWSIQDGTFRLDVEIPAGVAATVAIPAARPEDVLEGGKPATQAHGLRLIGVEGDWAVWEAGSGRYRFESPGFRAPI